MVFKWWPSIQWFRNPNSFCIRALPSPKISESLVSRKWTVKERVCRGPNERFHNYRWGMEVAYIMYAYICPICQTLVPCHTDLQGMLGNVNYICAQAAEETSLVKSYQSLSLPQRRAAASQPSLYLLCFTDHRNPVKVWRTSLIVKGEVAISCT